jgi:hypothetical protein
VGWEEGRGVGGRWVRRGKVIDREWEENTGKLAIFRKGSRKREREGSYHSATSTSAKEKDRDVSEETGFCGLATKVTLQQKR